MKQMGIIHYDSLPKERVCSRLVVYPNHGNKFTHFTGIHGETEVIFPTFPPVGHPNVTNK